MSNKKALILVDIQNDFLPTGALPVPLGDEVVDVANQLMNAFELVVATKDWHPKNHGSFASQHDGKNPFELIDLQVVDRLARPCGAKAEVAAGERLRIASKGSGFNEGFLLQLR